MNDCISILQTRWLQKQCSPASLALARWWYRRLLEVLGKDDASCIALLVALLQQQLESGATAIELKRFAGQALPLADPDAPANKVDISLPGLEQCQASLSAAMSQVPDLIGDSADHALVYAAGRLAWSRYVRAEECIAAALADTAPTWPLDAANCQSIKGLFAKDPSTLPQAWQQVAVSQILRNRRRGCRLSMLTGGPGTGKTTTVLRLLACLLHDEPALRIALAAPTGKAADRLAASVHGECARLPAALSAVLQQQLPSKASTLHSLLGFNPYSLDPSYSADFPLDCDLLVVDEASMVDPLMLAAVLAALPTSAHLVLVGDPDQLPSVGAGCVLSDMVQSCGIKPGEDAALDPATVHDLAPLGIELPVSPAQTSRRGLVASLRYSHRAGEHPELIALADAIIGGHRETVLSCLVDTAPCRRLEPDHPTVIRSAIAHAEDVAAAQNIDEAFERLARQQVICATRRGSGGADNIAQTVDEHLLASAAKHQGLWYHGRAVMISSNDPDRGFRNGDMGICWLDDKGLRVHFAGGRCVLPSDLPDHSCAWAITIHKSQGSEYDHPLIVLPEDPQHRLLLRELLFTAVTRAKKQVSIFATTAVIEAAVARPTQRDSWLATML